MADIQPIQIMVIVSGIFGFLLLIASSLFMDSGVAWMKVCNSCDISIFLLVGSIFGLLAALIQLLSAVMCYRNLHDWCRATIVVFIFAVIGFSLPVSKGLTCGGYHGQTDRGCFFVVISAMDFVYTFLAVVYTCYIGGQGVQ